VCDTPENGYACRSGTSHLWGQYSPWFDVASDADDAIPHGCDITFAQILSRHGARDPTAKKTTTYSNLVTRIHNSVTTYGPGYEFIKTYQYTLGADQLSIFGQQQMVNSGIKFFNRYKDLASKNTPFVRSSGQDRVVESALNWTQGFHATKIATTADPAYPYGLVSIPEANGVNNTLNHVLCTAFESGIYSTVGAAASSAWEAVFVPPIQARLNANLPGANLSPDETIFMMDLCPFNTVASPGGNTISPFCDLFTDDEWASYDYYQTLGKWYGYGPGNPLGPTQGVGFTNELIARLTNTLVKDATSTNRTLDSDPATFPLGLALYADFSHDNDMTGIFGAMGLYSTTKPLPTTSRETARQANGYSAAWTVPFAARMYVEKMKCTGHSEELVRVVVNDRVIKLQNCDADGEDRCTLSKFISSLSFAQSNGQWSKCFQ
jgi:hypothetical protein